MVDFRYHIVSIVAVFLALGTGLILGTTALPGPVIENLENNVRQLTEERNQRGQRIDALEKQNEEDRDFARALMPVTLADQLPGRHVVVVSAAGAPNEVRDAMVAALGMAGAEVTGRITLTDELGKPERARELDDLVDALLPTGGTLAGDTPVERAASEIAAAIGVRTNGAAQPDAPTQATTRVLAGLAESGYLDVDGQATQLVPAPLVLVVLPGPARRTASPSPSTVPDPAVALLAALSTRADGVVAVAAGDAVEGTSLLGQVRSDGTVSTRVSTVDNADTPQGQIAAVLALASELVDEQGHYGSGPGSERPVPSPVPNP